MVGTPDKIIKWLYNQEYDKIFEIKEQKKKRSLSQNSYAWSLINEIANSVRKSKEEVYFQMLKDYGQSQVVSMLSEINPNGYFKYFTELNHYTQGTLNFTTYKLYKGSSEFDSKEMTVFIDGIIQEAKQLGIETMTPDEIARWKLV